MNSTKKCAIVWMVTGILLFAVGCGWGLFIAPTPAPSNGNAVEPATIAHAIVSGIAIRVPEFIIKILSIVVLAQIVIHTLKKLSGIASLAELVDKMHANDDNDSITIIGVAGVIALSWVICLLPFNGSSYAIWLSTKIGFWMSASIVCSGILLKIFGFNSAEQTEMTIRTAGTEAASFCIGGGLIIAALMATVV